jgi:hypothetical protein
MAGATVPKLQALALLATGIGLGIGLDRLWPSPGPPPATPAPMRAGHAQAAPATAEPVRDYSLPDSGTILNLMLTDWFTSPAHRAEALSLLNDLPSEPSGTPQPPLRSVVIDLRATPKGYRPAIAGAPAVLADCGKRPPLAKGELKIWVRRFERRPGGVVEAEFDEGNYGYTGNSFTYRGRRQAGRWRVEFVSSNLSD